jgi:hypothetical protein
MDYCKSVINTPAVVAKATEFLGRNPETEITPELVERFLINLILLNTNEDEVIKMFG